MSPSSLSPRDVVFHLGVLEREGYVDTAEAMGDFSVAARLTTLGEQRVRERVRGSSRALKKPLFARVPAVGIGMRNPTDRDW